MDSFSKTAQLYYLKNEQTSHENKEKLNWKLMKMMDEFHNIYFLNMMYSLKYTCNSQFQRMQIVVVCMLQIFLHIHSTPPSLVRHLHCTPKTEDFNEDIKVNVEAE